MPCGGRDCGKSLSQLTGAFRDWKAKVDVLKSKYQSIWDKFTPEEKLVNDDYWSVHYLEGNQDFLCGYGQGFDCACYGVIND